MAFHFNADEIFQLAIHIEKNGARFYRLAAENARDESTSRLLLELASMEDEHEKFFIALRREISPQETELPVFDPNDEAAMYLKAMADVTVFELQEEPSGRLTGKETLEDIFRIAIGMENTSIAFYEGMKNMVPERLGKSRINAIIKEEMRHVALLSERLLSIKNLRGDDT